MSEAAEDPHADWKPAANPWLIAIAVTLATFMEVLDTTIVNVALPHIAGSLSASVDEATWVLTSYLVANGIVLTISGWLGDLLGRKRYFIICIAMFTVFSFLCGSAQSLAQLIVFRLAQGFFGGGMQPNQQSIILDTFPPAGRGAAFGVAAMATIVAPVLGPTLGGFITDQSSWRWIFFLNIPVGIVAVFLVTALVEDPPWVVERKSRGMDFIGLSLIAIGLGSLEIMLDRGQEADWFGSIFIRVMALAAFGGIVGAIFWLSVARRPIVHLAVFKDRNFATGCLMIAATGGILYSSAVMIPQLAQEYLNYTATWSGLILSPGGLSIIVLIPIVGRLLKVTPARNLVAAGFVIMGFSMLYSSHLAANINFGLLVSMRLFQTTALAFLFVPISTVAYMTLPRDLNPDAVALFSMFRNVAGSIGIALSTSYIARRSQTHQSVLADLATPFRQPFRELVATYAHSLMAMGHSAQVAQGMALGKIYGMIRVQAAIMAFSDTYVICAIVAFLVAPFAFLMTRRKSSGEVGAAH
jgi:MFS transporter, DHA2 family, multidrug resistance protein